MTILIALGQAIYCIETFVHGFWQLNLTEQGLRGKKCWQMAFFKPDLIDGRAQRHVPGLGLRVSRTHG